MNERIGNSIRNLERNGFAVRFFETGEEATAALLDSIGIEETVGIGGSTTVSNLGVFEKLTSRGNEVFWHNRTDRDKRVVMKDAANAKIYLTGTNGITEDGRLVNIDATGNRVSSMLFGHDRLYIIAGINKISANIEESIIRIKNTACPKNAERLGLDTPCRYLGKCTNCDSPQRMCNATLILERQPRAVKVIIFLINETLGY